jgi:RHS repeat-associated protein
MDAVGNLYRTPNLSDRRYSPGGRLDEAEGTKYEYDRRGNLISKTLADGAVWRYRWSFAGLLTEVERPDGRQIRFEYDPFARRTKKAVVCRADDGTESVESETHYLWDGHTLLHELRDGEDPVTWYWEPGTFTPVAKEQGRQQWSLAHDHLGTPTEMYDEAGQLVWQMSLDTFGEATFSQGQATDCPWRWPGQYEDAETGLYYNRFRYYDPEAGLYISQDPILIRGGICIYEYSHNSALITDPLGLIKITPVGGQINVGGIAETPNITNLNNFDTPLQDPSIIPNLVRGNAEDIGEIFEPESANHIMSRRLPGTVDFDRFARGAFQTLRPGGTIDISIYGLPDSPHVIEALESFRSAGFDANIRYGGTIIGTKAMKNSNC